MHHSLPFLILVLLFIINYPDYSLAEHSGSRGRGQSPFQKFAHERGIYFEGDIILPPNGEPGYQSSFWKDGIIPFVMRGFFHENQKRAIYKAMEDIMSKTCIRFQFHKNEDDYLWITNFNRGRCYSFVGQRMRGAQPLNLGPGCFHITTIIHELVHAIGLWHEQSRKSRDKWIDIDWSNIPWKHWREFQRYQHQPENYETDYDYDYLSVMHYSFNAFSRDRLRPTIRTRNKFPLKFLGRGDVNGGLTILDAKKINVMYNCTK